MEQSPYLTVSETARSLGVSVDTIRKWADKDTLPSRHHPTNGYR